MRRLYRVTGTWPDGTTEVRHYLTRKAALNRAALYRDGRPAEPGTYDHLNGEVGAREAVPPASSVVVDWSDPVTFPADYPPRTRGRHCA